MNASDIDCPSSYSGISWAVNGGAKTIRLINNWPNPEARNATADKVPSIISYAGGPSKWGYDVDVTREECFRWIKVLLETESRYANVVEPVKKSNELLGRLNKSAVSVVADYLRLLWNYTTEDIKKLKGADFRQIYALKVVMSVPAMWSPAAKDKTREAAKLAGLGEDVMLVTEPEAAALATLKDKSDMEELQVSVVLVDIKLSSGMIC